LTLAARQLTQEFELTEQSQSNPPTFTPPPTNPPTRTLPAPTLDVTPTLITATPGGDFGIVETPLPSTPGVVENPPPDAPTATFTVTPFTPTPLPPETIRQGFITPIPPPVFNAFYSTANIQSFQLNFGPGSGFTFNGITTNTEIGRYIANPASPGSFIIITPQGTLTFSQFGNPEIPFPYSPFFEGYQAGSAADNKNYVRDVAWAPNGYMFAFIVDPLGNPDNIGAGVWLYHPDNPGDGPTYALIRDCIGGYQGCDIVANESTGYLSRKLEWSPGSDAILVTLDLPGEGRNGLAVVPPVRDSTFGSNAPGIGRYDSGYWTADGNLIVSGRRPDGLVVIATVDRNFNGENILFNASAANLWMQDAVVRPDGAIVALGRECCPGGPLRLYLIRNGNATPISGDIGGGAPSSVRWAADRSSVVLTVGGQQFLVNAFTGEFGAFAPGFSGPIIDGVAGSAPVFPDGVVEGSRYVPGQQVLFVGTGDRNMRQTPGLNGNIVDVVRPNEFVGILAGPYDANGYTWWYVSNARDRRGWMAADVNSAWDLNP
jgi:hypothetical protein